MLKFYLSFTGSLQGNRRLFRKCQGDGDVCTKTISTWLKNCIIYIYDKLLKHDKPITAKGHEVRKMSTSWALAAGASISDILAAASWSSTSTFAAHYLVDVQKQLDGKFRLAPVVPGLPKRS